MVKPNPLSKSVWAQLGRGTRGRDTEDPGAPVRVSEDAQARNNIDQNNAARLFEFSQQKRDPNQLPVRPSTSAGPGSVSSFAKRRNAEKRETKDDLHFNPLAAHGVGTTFYNFPLPGSLPTPASSPKSAHHPATRKPQGTRPSTPESMEIAPAKMNVPQAEIGMALGSPQHPPTAWQQVPMDRYTESPDHIDDDFSNSVPVKQKTSKWKILGGLFGGKKHEAQPAAFYQLQPETSQQAPVNHGFDFGDQAASSEKPKSRGRGRSNSSARKAWKQKPDMSRADTVPPRFDLEGSGRQNQTGTPEITIDGGTVIYDGAQSTQKGAGLLDVDIPSVQMERYSIMFGSVLQKPQSQSSSLLARRQATLDKLKTVNEALASKERELEAKSKLLMPRRATSPGFKTQSPAFSLFPSTPRTRDAYESQSRPSVSLQRSNTSPAALSPSRPSFAPGLSNENHASLVSADSPTVPIRQHPDMYRGPRALRKKEEPIAVPEPAPEDKKWSPDQSHLLLDSSSENEGDKEDEDYIAVAVPMKPRLPEPSWQMVNPNHATNDSVSNSSTSGSDHSTSTSASSITTPLSASTAPYPIVKPLRINSPSQTRTRAATVSQTGPSMTRSRSATTVAAPSSVPRRNVSAAIPSPSAGLSSPKSEEDEARLESAADVSIARQISVSRQQRQLLVPIKTTLKTPSTGSLSKKFVNPTPINPNGSPMKDRVVGGQNFPSPATGIGAVGYDVGKVISSPLGAIATATKEERERGEGRGRRSPQAVHQSSSGREKSPTERLVQVAKPSTPTLVVVGEGVDEKEKGWSGATSNPNKPQSHAPVGFSERRRQKETTSSNSSSHLHANPTIGEIRVGLAVTRDGSSTRQVRDMSHRKSERVVVERVSVASN
ncbi:hypothetical protein BKA65DRAFT_104012 [Rhexocercosporidium sp. MPI-PUGE-AT-0058]|nr:hypothetical protein BKA65DRAFT_104012 [Rhexocercosporidium sp. MPI-PUGE-AT-0058]